MYDLAEGSEFEVGRGGGGREGDLSGVICSRRSGRGWCEDPEEGAVLGDGVEERVKFDMRAWTGVEERGIIGMRASSGEVEYINKYYV